MKNIFAIYKPKGPTSNGVLEEVGRITGIRKIGHAGTLDPLAKGVLVVGIGEGTKLLTDIVGKEKEYIAKIKFGATSETDDEEGKKIKIKIVKKSALKEIWKIVYNLKGEIMQKPPVYSAIKVKGKEAYKLARKGEMPELQPRKVKIKNIRIIKYRWPYLWLRVITGPGVYIRALARDIGKELGIGGYLAGLERTRVGEFKKGKALTMSQFKKTWNNRDKNSQQRNGENIAY